MKIKRFAAADTRAAMRAVREAWGDEAVILSNQRTAQGVEVVAAIDFDERALSARAGAAEGPRVQEMLPNSSIPKPAPADAAPQAQAINAAMRPGTDSGTERQLRDMQTELLHLRGLLEGKLSQLAWRERGRATPLKGILADRLSGLGLTPDMAAWVAGKTHVTRDREANWLAALRVLTTALRACKNDPLEEGGLFALVGATGTGKTTTAAKLVARFALQHGRDQVAMISTDSYRIGGQEQLQTFGRLLRIPVEYVTTAVQLTTAVKTFADRKLVLIDTAGVHCQGIRFNEQMGLLRQGAPDVKKLLVLSATTHLGNLRETLDAFRTKHASDKENTSGQNNLSGVILTKLDEAASLGALLSVVLQHRLAIAYTAGGQRVPEDIGRVQTMELVTRAVELMDTHGWQQQAFTGGIAAQGAAG